MDTPKIIVRAVHDDGIEVLEQVKRWDVQASGVLVVSFTDGRKVYYSPWAWIRIEHPATLRERPPATSIPGPGRPRD